MLVAAFLSGKMLGYESRKHDEREEQKPNYLKELAICRDVFDTPPPGDKLETTWVAAMVSPEAVPLYVEACRQDYINKLDAKDEEIRVVCKNCGSAKTYFLTMALEAVEFSTFGS